MAKVPKPPVGRILERKSGERTKQVSAYLDITLYLKFRRRAKAEGRQMSWIIATLVSRYLDEHDK